ncbi:MAG: hypothetical protein HYV26_16435 [Candidatus Hydrogenedentes bacterium]|nr:hypothetical protein [Candidatus Hydrogenedentota bacterium]MBI3117217.1 hypothetical protein [Candidatus Hydrogenedentota bacterium]
MSASVGALAPAIIVCVVFGSLLAGLAIISWTIVRLVSGSRGRAGSAEESQLIQELYTGLHKMEQRVEALETLLLERDQRGSTP